MKRLDLHEDKTKAWSFVGCKTFRQQTRLQQTLDTGVLVRILNSTRSPKHPFTSEFLLLSTDITSIKLISSRRDRPCRHRPLALPPLKKISTVLNTSGSALKAFGFPFWMFFWKIGNIYLLTTSFFASGAGLPAATGAAVAGAADAAALLIRSLMLRPLSALAKRPGQ